MQEQNNLSPNMIYKKYVVSKSANIPFSDFIEVENRKYKACNTDIPFQTWLNNRYAQGGDRAWFNQETGSILSEIGFNANKEYSNLTDANSSAISSIATLAATLAANKANKNASKTEYDKALKLACGNPLIKGKKYHACVLKFDTQLKAAAPTVSIPTATGVPGAGGGTTGLPVMAWVGIGVGVVVIGGLVIYAIKKNSKK